MITAIYKVDTVNVHWETAHFFKHLFVRSWHEYLMVNGYHPGLSGWLSGTMYEGRLFFSAGFYDEKVQRLLDEFIHDLVNKRYFFV